MTPEDSLQITVAEHLDRIGLDWFHVPNGGSRNVIEARKLKRMGIKAGVPDVLIFRPCWTPAGRYIHGLAIELKAGKNKLEPSQKDWRGKLVAKGWVWQECRSLDDVIDTLKKAGI